MTLEDYEYMIRFPGKAEPVFPLCDDGRIGLFGRVVLDVPIAVFGAAVGAAVPAAVGRRWQHTLQVRNKTWTLYGT